jgi:hypothetical protein
VVLGGIEGERVARLAQTSIRFRRFDISERHFQELSTEVDGVAEETTRAIYGRNVEVDVVLAAGSLLVQITVIGGLLWGGYDAVSKYKDFKDGLKELANDAQKFGSAIYNKELKLTDQDDADSVAIKDMTPGKIARVIQRLEEVQKLEKTAPNRVVREELQEIARDVQAIVRDLEPEEIKSIDNWLELNALPPLEKLPKPRPAHKREKKHEIEEVKPPRALRPADKKERLRYHNRFAVGKRKSR